MLMREGVKQEARCRRRGGERAHLLQREVLTTTRQLEGMTARTATRLKGEEEPTGDFCGEGGFTYFCTIHALIDVALHYVTSRLAPPPARLLPPSNAEPLLPPRLGVE
jgi:hypothetical protein